MKSNKELEEYLSKGVNRIIKGIAKASFVNPKASLFMVKYGFSSKKAQEKRKEAEQCGEHIPPFLITSITEQCNLHCKGCYARANHCCNDQGSELTDGKILSAEQWGDIFKQASEVGVTFILLAGGEPFVRRDVIEQAGQQDDIIFPIFTNGTMINEQYLSILEQHRNLMPVISIEGNQDTTDDRRGEGVYIRIQNTMKQLQKEGLMFGASVTVTKENMQEVLSDEFVHTLQAAGTKAVIYVEYVPVNQQSQELAPDDEDRRKMMERLDSLRQKEQEMIFIAFPGDEKTSGGCLAAGRGFFHINARGGVEPCPFSPYSDTNILDSSLREALHSPLFHKLQVNGNLTQEHIGGCVLFEQKEVVEAMIK